MQKKACLPSYVCELWISRRWRCGSRGILGCMHCSPSNHDEGWIRMNQDEPSWTRVVSVSISAPFPTLFSVFHPAVQTPKTCRVPPSNSKPLTPSPFAGSTGLLKQGGSPRVKSQSVSQGCSWIPVLCPVCWQECPPDMEQYPNSIHSECSLPWPSP